MASIRQGVYAITDFSSLTEVQVYMKTETILKAGISLLQYRDKLSDKNTRYRRAIELQRLCSIYDTPFIINDDIELAKSCNADGIHLGKDDSNIDTARQALGKVIIGCSCYNSIELAMRAQEEGADYIAFGAFNHTKTKNNTVKAEPGLLSLANNVIELPIVAIGGITPKNAKVLLDNGTDLLAVISALYHANDTADSIKQFNLLFN